MSSSNQSATTLPSSSKRKMIRYTIVSAIASPANLLLYALLLHETHWPPAISNMIAAFVVVGPTFVANRWWVWEVQSSSGWHKDIPPFVSWTLFGIACSSTATWIASRHAPPAKTLLLVTLSTYALIWVSRYLFLDKVLFRNANQVVQQAPDSEVGGASGAAVKH